MLNRNAPRDVADEALSPVDRGSARYYCSITLPGACKMSVPSHKLPDELKKRIPALIAGSGRVRPRVHGGGHRKGDGTRIRESKRLVKGARSVWWAYRLLAYPKGNTLCITSCSASLA